MRSYKKIFSLLIFFFSFALEVSGKVSNSIVLKVGNQIVTEGDLRNEILTNLILNKKEINQENINISKNSALNTLKNYYLKKNEIEKYKIERFNRSDLDNYLNKVSNSLGISRSDLKKFFNNNNLNYELFEDKYKTNLIWNTLIFSLYKNQIDLNMIEIDNELEKIISSERNLKEFNLSEIQLDVISENQGSFIKQIKETILKESFSVAVSKFSKSPTKDNNGNLGWVSEKSLSANYQQKLKNLKKGEISDPIVDGNSIIFLKVNDLRYNKNKNTDAKKIKENIVNKKKNEKLNLFSRTHLVNVENNTFIEMKK